MCVVSMVGDHYGDKWNKRDWFQTIPSDPIPFPVSIPGPVPIISREEFDELKRDVLEMKELLKRAKKYDEDNGEPDCEVDEKIAILKKVGQLVGVDLDDVLVKKSE